jgi:hypothetical protein
MNDFVPNSEKIPLTLNTEVFKIRPLTIHDVVKDYAAVMSSIAHLKGLFDPSDSWPTEDLSFEQDLIDLGWHQKEFQNRSSFAFTVMSSDEAICLGCIYIYPSKKALYDANVFLWIRQSHSNLLDTQLFTDVKNWLDQQWWFKSVAYPGRQPTWQEWALLPAK